MLTLFSFILSAVTISVIHAARVGLLRVGNLPARHLGVKPKFSQVNSALFDEDMQAYVA